MNRYELLNELGSYPTFSVDDISNLTDKEPEYSRLILHRLWSKGMIHRLQRDTYTLQKDPLLFASSIIWPSYISLWYALRYHDMTEQVPYRIDVMTTSRTRNDKIEFKGYEIAFTTISDELLFGYRKERISDIDVFIAESEKAIVDSLVLGRISINEIMDMIDQNRKRISMDKLEDTISLCGNKAAAKRLGWILDELGILRSKKLHQMIYPTIIPLERSLPMEGKKDGYWGVLVNTEGGLN